MKHIWYTYKWIFLIVALALLIRIWQLGVVPPSPDWDEAALGYNAYSILKTGKDEYGTKFPLVIRSFDDYKPPLYVYLAIPSIALFGLDVWSVRLPSVVLGTLAVLGVYMLVAQLVKYWAGDKKDLEKFLPIASSVLLALSPWHIQFSRIAFEANSGVTINIWAVYAFLRGLREKTWLWLSAFLFGLGLYAYHSQRIFLPLLVLILVFTFRRQLSKQKINVVMFILVGIVTVLPLIPVFFNKTTLTRLRGTSALADQTRLLEKSVRKLEYDQKRNDFLGLVLDNRRIVWLQTLAFGYLSHYSFRWLFLTGDNPRHHAPDMGILYLWELPFLLWGLYAVARRGGAASKILVGWLIIAPIAASPTTELPHAIRSLVFLPSFQVFTAAGLYELWKNLKRKSMFLRLSSLALIAVIVGGSLVYYFHMYFVHQNLEVSQYWQFGYKQAVEYAERHKVNYKKIVVSTKLEQPHMFFLFYLRYDPKIYLAEGGTSSGGFAEVRNKFGIYEFRPIEWEKEAHDGSVLYIGAPDEIPTAGHTIYFLDGSEAIRIGDI